MAYGSQKYLFKRDNYEVRRNTTDEQLDALWEAVGLGGGPGSGIGITGEENTFAELPAPAGRSGEYWSVLTTTGIIGFRKFSGLYRSDGTNWIYLGNPVAVASDVANVPAGTISATDVQGAVNEIDSDLTAHIGSRGASHATSTTSEAGFMSAADHLKLSGIQAAATANSPDATLLNRANHTGTQASSTITNFNTDVDARVTLQMSAHTAAADTAPLDDSLQGMTTPVTATAVSASAGTAAALTAAAGPVNIITTNIPGAMIIPFANDALAAGAIDRWREDFSYPIATSAQATATTIVAPVQTGVIWRITAGYYVAP